MAISRANDTMNSVKTLHFTSDCNSDMRRGEKSFAIGAELVQMPLSQPLTTGNKGREERTRATLLERLREGQDALAWDDFVRIYWRPMFAFARKYGCCDATAEDVV